MPGSPTTSFVLFRARSAASPRVSFVMVMLVAMVAAILAVDGPANAQTEFHVAPGGDDAGPGSSAQPWATIGKANATLLPGDTVVIHAGTYNEQIRPVNSGTSDRDRIIYRVAGDGDVVLTLFPSAGDDSDGALALAGRNYVTVSGAALGDTSGERQLVLRPSGGHVNNYGSVCGSEGVVVEYVEMVPGAAGVPGRGFDFCLNFEEGSRETRYNVLRHSLIVGVSSPSQQAVDYTEDLVTLAHNAHHNLIEHNELRTVKHSVLYADSPISHSNVIRANLIANPEHTALSIWSAGVDLADGARFLVEGNRLIGSGDTDHPHGGPGNALQWGSDELIIRHNVIERGGAALLENQHSTSGGLAGSTGFSYGAAYFATDGRVYNNSIVANRGPSVAVQWFEDGVDLGRHRFINNVVYGPGNDIAPGRLVSYWDGTTSTNDRWIANVFGVPGGSASDDILISEVGPMSLSEAIASLTNPTSPEFSSLGGFDNLYSATPGFTDYSGGDYLPAGGSLLIDGGAPITSVADADAGTGTSLAVDDARPFFAEAGGFPAWMGVGFESILVGASPASATAVQILGVDDATGVLTLAQSVSRSDGDGVWLATDSAGNSRIAGTAPDIGAYEVGTTGGNPRDGGGTQPDGRFVDVPPTHTFAAEIEWLADQGITLGCNPPTNTEFCPDAPVTRAQMASFLVRAVAYPIESGGGVFVDDDGSVHEGAIEALAAAGVTQGCSAADPTLFCPDDPVTRAQMASFLVRAVGLSVGSGGGVFVDDDGSVHEGAIEALAAAGITEGCSTSDPGLYCPDDPVSRAQMAAFLFRALADA